jgi:hypothetical protein
MNNCLIQDIERGGGEYIEEDEEDENKEENGEDEGRRIWRKSRRR